jgi:hypothetical protein
MLAENNLKHARHAASREGLPRFIRDQQQKIRNLEDQKFELNYRICRRRAKTSRDREDELTIGHSIQRFKNEYQQVISSMKKGPSFDNDAVEAVEEIEDMKIMIKEEEKEIACWELSDIAKVIKQVSLQGKFA